MDIDPLSRSWETAGGPPAGPADRGRRSAPPVNLSCGSASPSAFEISWTYGRVTGRIPDVASWTGDLTVGLVSAGETARFGQLLEAHHGLGARLFGSVVRHVAVLDGSWVALLGYGSAVLRCTARDTVIGWPDADRVDRLPMLAGQQRFCVLPQGRRPQLASAVLARSLARLPGDYLELHNQVVLAAETFTDPARHTGACYAAARFACPGPPQGDAPPAGG